MPLDSYHAQKVLERILGDDVDVPARLAALAPRPPETEPLPGRVPAGTVFTEEALAKRRGFLQQQGICTEALTRYPDVPVARLQGNIENFVGFVGVPVGVIGPLRVNGTCAHGDFYVPMATTEGALLASYQRGAHVISRAGGASVVCFTESVSRAPCFVFRNLQDAGAFMAWALPQFGRLQDIVATTSNHCRLTEVKTSITGRDVFLIFEFTTGDAAGQNMVTLATDAICQQLLAEAPVKPEHWYIEGNMSGDKKATVQSFTHARGKKVVAEAVLPRRLVQRFINGTPEDLERYCKRSTLGGIQSGSIGVQGHYANALAALFIACGQDAACVAEAAIGVTCMDTTDAGDLYVSVSLPNLIVGVVGGGTHLPTARACLEMLGSYGTGNARKFAEICGATVLAGEISIIGALATGEFVGAHARLGRKK